MTAIITRPEFESLETLVAAIRKGNRDAAWARDLAGHRDRWIASKRDDRQVLRDLLAPVEAANTLLEEAAWKARNAAANTFREAIRDLNLEIIRLEAESILLLQAADILEEAS